ncbi:glycine-rich cell wall structural protein 1-like [Stylophora pistillata]|uniref:glycine-rich cell wall structural protein 1-like n=1 Tax=Stylophora pistillata TaxID=50429 RepID=UPI000C04B895|nr:glycine-rich cell wall structural protein 1-like [Stylophora pistillata]
MQDQDIKDVTPAQAQQGILDTNHGGGGGGFYSSARSGMNFYGTTGYGGEGGKGFIQGGVGERARYNDVDGGFGGGGAAYGGKLGGGGGGGGGGYLGGSSGNGGRDTCGGWERLLQRWKQPGQ